MYLPSHFEQTDTDRIRGLIRACPLGMLVTAGPDGLDANHLPFILDPDRGPHGTLLCHVARANPVWRELADAQAESLAVFQGPSAYVSPSLYETKRTTHEVVPTYNYAVVHAHGRIIVHDDPRWVAGLVGRLTRMFEHGRDDPWKMSDAPPAFLEERLSAIVGLEMPIARLQAKWKMSQNRSEADRRGVMAGLEASGQDGDRAVAAAMKAAEKASPAD